MKHCLGMEIFDCAVLVAEALVAYQKARLSRRAERLRQRQMFQRGIRGQELLAPRNETHDRVRIFFSPFNCDHLYFVCVCTCLSQSG